MGTNNRQRRAAKAKRRAKQQTKRSRDGWSDRPGGQRFTPAERVRGLLGLAASPVEEGDDEPAAAPAAVEALARSDAGLVDAESEAMLLEIIGRMWYHGWQPAEVVRLARRRDARAGRLVAAAVAADHVRRDRDTLHPRWAAQLDALGLPEVHAVTGWVPAFARQEWLDRRSLIATVVAALQVLWSVGPLPTIISPPGAGAGRTSCDARFTDDPVLVRVRALLAQAESTTFEAEAETFTAKAQELMARHAIDVALLWAGSERDERPTSIRLPIDDPYADIKSLLLQRVAHNSRCTAVWHPSYSLSTVVGFASDVMATEMLFTSLLVQSQTALQAEAAKAGPGGRTRSRGFRSSFLLAFTHRIDERLAKINAAVEGSVVAGEHDLLPVLASRDDAVQHTVTELFGSLQSGVVRGGTDAAGWARGTMAADLAHLNAGNLAGHDNHDGRERREQWRELA